MKATEGRKNSVTVYRELAAPIKNVAIYLHLPIKP